MPELRGATIHVLGRLAGLTRRRLAELLRRAGARHARGMSRRVDLLVLGHGTAASVLEDAPILSLPPRTPTTVKLVSELTFKRALGLLPPLGPEPRTLTAVKLSELSGLDRESLACLRFYDVLEVEDDRYGYRDLVTAREVARLLDAGSDFAGIVSAAVQLRRRGLRLSEVRLAEAPSGELLRHVEDRLVGFDGQYPLPLPEGPTNVDALVASAEDAELDGEFERAERLYRLALAMDPTDPVIPFNLGNLLEARGRPRDAAICWQIALERDPYFAEARYNLAIAAEQAGRIDRAIDLYLGALQAQPDYADAAHNLALLLTEEDRYAEALSAWEHYLALEPRPKEILEARRYAAYCRFRLRADEA